MATNLTSLKEIDLERFGLVKLSVELSYQRSCLM